MAEQKGNRRAVGTEEILSPHPSRHNLMATAFQRLTGNYCVVNSVSNDIRSIVFLPNG